MKGKQNIEVKVVNKEKFKKNFWAPFRVPTDTDQEIIKNPWVFPWLREKGKKEFWTNLRFKGNVKEIPVDVKDKDNKFIVSAKMPEVSKKDINIEATDDNIIIITKNKSEDISNLGRAIKFHNKINPDKTKASFKENNLKIEIPKKEKVIKKAGKKIKMNK